MGSPSLLVCVEYVLPLHGFTLEGWASIAYVRWGLICISRGRKRNPKWTEENGMNNDKGWRAWEWKPMCEQKEVMWPARTDNAESWQVSLAQNRAQDHHLNKHKGMKGKVARKIKAKTKIDVCEFSRAIKLLANRIRVKKVWEKGCEGREWSGQEICGQENCPWQSHPHNASLRHQSFGCTAGLLSKGKASSFGFRP